jgi:hypothetical protein
MAPRLRDGHSNSLPPEIIVSKSRLPIPIPKILQVPKVSPYSQFQLNSNLCSQHSSKTFDSSSLLEYSYFILVPKVLLLIIWLCFTIPLLILCPPVKMEHHFLAFSYISNYSACHTHLSYSTHSDSFLWIFNCQMLMQP